MVFDLAWVPDIKILAKGKKEQQHWQYLHKWTEQAYSTRFLEFFLSKKTSFNPLTPDM